MTEVSIVIPAYNEAGAVGQTVKDVQQAFESSGHTYEIIVVNDGSRDETGREAEEAGAIVVSHPKNIGYGNAIITGIRRARYPLIWLTDADGKAYKSYLFLWIDDYSRKILFGKYYASEKLPRMEDSFKYAVLRYGIPEKAYLDYLEKKQMPNFVCVSLD